MRRVKVPDFFHDLRRSAVRNTENVYRRYESIAEAIWQDASR
jgi:hypothetical protein